MPYADPERQRAWNAAWAARRAGHGVTAAQAYEAVGGRDNAPTCPCCGRPMKWSRNPALREGGRWLPPHRR